MQRTNRGRTGRRGSLWSPALLQGDFSDTEPGRRLQVGKTRLEGFQCVLEIGIVPVENRFRRKHRVCVLPVGELGPIELADNLLLDALSRAKACRTLQERQIL